MKRGSSAVAASAAPDGDSNLDESASGSSTDDGDASSKLRAGARRSEAATGGLAQLVLGALDGMISEQLDERVVTGGVCALAHLLRQEPAEFAPPLARRGLLAKVGAGVTIAWEPV